MNTTHLLVSNLLSPMFLAFVLGIVAKFVRSDLEFPEQVLKALGIYFLFSLGLEGGYALSTMSIGQILLPMLVAVGLVLALPVWYFFILRTLGKFSIENAAGITALYTSVSSVTFVTAMAFAKTMGTEADSYVVSLVTIMELSVIVSLFIARLQLGKKAEKAVPAKEIFIDTLRGRSFVLLIGGMVIGGLITKDAYATIDPVFGQLFKGLLMLFLLEMGMVAASKIREFFKVGLFMLAFGTLMPLLSGTVAIALGTLAGMSVGSAFVFGAIVASASYIDAPAVVRATFPQANPSIYLTSSLGITFPFNLAIGLPVYYTVATMLGQYF